MFIATTPEKSPDTYRSVALRPGMLWVEPSAAREEFQVTPDAAWPVRTGEGAGSLGAAGALPGCTARAQEQCKLLSALQTGSAAKNKTLGNRRRI